MTSPARETEPRSSERVMVLAPTGRDGPLICDLLRRAGVEAIDCASLSRLCRDFGEDAGALLIADEALAGEAARSLRAVLDRQEAWSDIPVLVFTHRGGHNGHTEGLVSALGERNVSLLERPIGVRALVSTARSALRDRRRQYAVRGLVRDLESLNGSLERRVAERTAELGAYRDQLKALAAKLAATEQQERRRIAVELHDYLAQLLLACRMKIDTVKTADPRAAASLAEARAMIGEATQYTRTLMTDLSPASLYELGLEAALDGLGDQMKKRHDLGVTLVEAGEPRPVPEEARVALFECTRELLFNVVKHARAGAARVVVAYDPATVRLTVEDDGAGFDAAAARFRPGASGGWGLFNIRERIDRVGGELTVESEPGKGARFTLSVPLAAESPPSGT